MKKTLLKLSIILLINQTGFTQIHSLKDTCVAKIYNSNKSKIDFNSVLKNSTISDYCDYLNMFIFAQDDKQQYLGKITTNKFDSESIINEFGSYGSEFSSTSIRNEFSTYGSEFGTYSAYNEFASYPPIVYKWESSSQSYIAMAYLTKNTLKTPALDPDILIAVLESDECNQINPTNPDLEAKSIWISETDYKIGDSVTINFSITNNSEVDINEIFYTSLWLVLILLI